MSMTDAQINDIYRVLTRYAGPLLELRHVTTFKGYWGENEEEVTIEIEDYGPDCDVPSQRYRVHAVTKSGRIATGNGAESIAMAIMTTHWDKLGK